MSTEAELTFREGRPSDLRATFELAAHAFRASAKRRGTVAMDDDLEAAELNQGWLRERPFLEFVASQADGRYLICQQGERIVGYARVSRFGEMDELTELYVAPDYGGRGVGRALLERCWPQAPTPELGRVVVTLGTPVDLSLYTDFGVMPVTGHWHMRRRATDYLEQRSQEMVDATEPAVHLLQPERAVQEWKRLEPSAIGHERPLLHDFFGRTRVCLASMGSQAGQASGLCWVSSDGEIGPAVGETPEDLVPVVLAALDRVAKAHEPDMLGLFCTTDSWWLLDRLRRLGFEVFWPAWVMCSVPLPGLDRYLPTRPARLL